MAGETLRRQWLSRARVVEQGEFYAPQLLRAHEGGSNPPYGICNSFREECSTSIDCASGVCYALGACPLFIMDDRMQRRFNREKNSEMTPKSSLTRNGFS
ncbi:MAG: hypothetical protein IH897_11210 [Planctomycetes bacterium]|nr:hypothetical protein [Planctomycetota bacterium]